jgi:hypothetical protein
VADGVMAVMVAMWWVQFVSSVKVKSEQILDPSDHPIIPPKTRISGNNKKNEQISRKLALSFETHKSFGGWLAGCGCGVAVVLPVTAVNYELVPPGIHTSTRLAVA